MNAIQIQRRALMIIAIVVVAYLVSDAWISWGRLLLPLSFDAVQFLIRVFGIETQEQLAELEFVYHFVFVLALLMLSTWLVGIVRKRKSGGESSTPTA